MTEVSIADQLKNLIELQKIDGQIYQLKQELELKPLQSEELKTAQQAAAQELKDAENRYKGMEVKRKDLENDLASKEEQIKKLQGQLFQLKTNKEYSAMQKEIEGHRADNSVLEEEILKLMEEIDKVKNHVSADQDEIKKKEASVKADLARLEQETQQVESSIQVLRTGREKILPTIDPKVLSQYERILTRKEGTALVPVVAGVSCGGCNIVLPPQLVNEVQLANRLVLCESCARILFVDPTT
jgi:uncharacterized protein